MGDLSDSQSGQIWCAFSRSVCNQNGHCVSCIQCSLVQGYDGIHRSWEEVIIREEQWPKREAK